MNVQIILLIGPWIAFLSFQVAEQKVRNEDAGQYTELVRDFLNPKDFYNALCMHGMDYFCGVPDSLLKDFCAYVTAVTPKSRHVITSNEGQAIALAAGYHMATGRSGVVYLQVSAAAHSDCTCTLALILQLK